MNFDFLLRGQEENLVPCGFDSEIRSMGEDCQGSNVRLKDRNVENSEFPNDFRQWGCIRFSITQSPSHVVDVW